MKFVVQVWKKCVQMVWNGSLYRKELNFILSVKKNRKRKNTYSFKNACLKSTNDIIREIYFEMVTAKLEVLSEASVTKLMTTISKL